MKNFVYYIFLLLFIISCKEDGKETIDTPPKKEVVPTDSLSNLEKKIETDTVAIVEKKPVANIIIQKEEEATYKIESISELWQRYKSAKISVTKYIAENNLDSIIYHLNIAANASYDLSREDIATWQLNNIGYYSITEFKKRTNYDERMEQLASIKNLRKKGLLLEETITLFTEHFEILSNAESYLYKAKLLDSEFEKSDRTDIIESNLQFINWIDGFISGESK